MGGQGQGTDGRLLAGRYRLGEVLGKGGMGTVWRGVDKTLGRTVAVKELRFPHNIDEDEKRRLITRTLREAKATARIRHTGAVTVFDVVEEDGRPWIVMELVEGRSLSDAIREDGPLTPKRAAEVGLTVLDVLKAAHKEGILHRDVKPSNVLIGDEGRAVLSDFGIAQVDGDPSVTSTGMLVGAPSYMSPERARGQKPGPPADLWSLGVLLYASVEGRPPYDKGSALATLTAVMMEELPPPPNAGPLAEAIHGLLIKDPDLRLDDAGVRPILTEIVNAPDAPVAPVPDDTHEVRLPADPQPTPTDAPAETRKAVADQARVRSALRSVRDVRLSKPGKARRETASTPASLPAVAKAEQPLAVGPAGPAGQSGQQPNRPLIIAVIAVLLAVIGTSIGFALAHWGDRGAHTKVLTGAGGSAGSSASGSNSGSPSKNSASGSAAGSALAGAPRTVTDGLSGSSPVGSLPSGYRTVTNSEFHFSVAMPTDWQARTVAGQNSGQRYWGSSAYPRLQIDYTGTPGSNAKAAWLQQESASKGSFTGYQRISLTAVDYRGYRTAADWEFTFNDNGTKMRAVDRGFVTDATHGYAIYFIAPAADWNSAGVKQLLTTFFKTFEPTK
jgi:serine/threonine protein kinase